MAAVVLVEALAQMVVASYQGEAMSHYYGSVFRIHEPVTGVMGVQQSLRVLWVAMVVREDTQVPSTCRLGPFPSRIVISQAISPVRVEMVGRVVMAPQDPQAGMVPMLHMVGRVARSS